MSNKNILVCNVIDLININESMPFESLQDLRREMILIKAAVLWCTYEKSIKSHEETLCGW